MAPPPVLASRPSRKARRAVLWPTVLLVGVVGQLLVTEGPASAGQVGVTVNIRGSGLVESVEGSLEDGASGVCDWRSNKDERVTRSCPRFRNEELLEAWVWLRATPSAVPSGHWRLSHWSGCHETRVRDGHTECAVHSGAADAVEAAPTAHFLDDFAPTVSPVTEAFSTTVERTVSFFFSTNEGQLECRFDAELTFNNCSSAVMRTFATEGSHTLDVRAVDESGQISSSSSRTVKVIDTAVTGGPTELSNTRSPTFTYSSGAGTAFECSLDGSAFTFCPSGGTYTGLADGAHTFRVRAVDGGWYDRIPSVRGWIIDATPPQTTLISAAPDEGSASFTYSSSESGTFQCRLSTETALGTWTTCASPTEYDSLADADYTFEVRAVDLAGNVDPVASSHSWSQDTSAPQTQILSGPAHGSFVLSSNATFGYASDEEGSIFSCTVDGAATDCPGSQLGLSGLSRRTHEFTVKAIDPVFNNDPTPARRTWTVPLDDTQLTASSHWVRRSDSKAYLGTFSQASRQGAVLRKGVSGARRVALVLTKAPDAGTVRVYAGSRLLGTVKLAAASTMRKQVVPMPRFEVPFTGTVKVVVVTSGRAVRLDGLGVATR